MVDSETWFGNRDVAVARIWNGFTTARVMVALAVLLLQGVVYALGQGTPRGPFLALCGAYMVATLFVRMALRPRPDEPALGRLWLPTVGVDLLAFSAMQALQPGGLNYTPLLGLPVLMAAVLGSGTTALGTAAGVTLLLLADAGWAWFVSPGTATSHFVQAGLTGIGYFVVSSLVNPLATRLAREEKLARQGQQAAAVQAQVNELVIESLAGGVLVVDRDGLVRVANPAARLLLGATPSDAAPPFSLLSLPTWRPLADLAADAFAGDGRQEPVEVVLQHDDGTGPRRLQVQVRQTPPLDAQSETLCVMFLEDLREGEARLRTEKLAAMGRMSAAVAHEIRNPLAAIVQANQLLDEDLRDPAHKQLVRMVAQNAQRLARIAEEVLDVSRAQRQLDFDAAPTALDDTVTSTCIDWHVHAGRGCGLQFITHTDRALVQFDAEHLRRVLVNLLDNALRYISQAEDALQVRTLADDGPGGRLRLEVWSDGAPLEPAVQQRLFEPFFSSESRSSGLGLYICRELCERHGATLGYSRLQRPTRRGLLDGNAFTVVFRPVGAPAAAAAFDTIAP
jgi:two-component system sensor histidine kinase PilS (NtrC family)